LVIAAVSVVASCTAGSGVAVDDWSRSYRAGFDRVFEAVLDTLEESEYYLDTVDKESGRVRAESSARRRDLEVTLIVDVEEREGRVRVDVMARSSGGDQPEASGRMSGVVREFLSGLDSRLEGRVD
jgi:hypothetical protein